MSRCHNKLLQNDVIKKNFLLFMIKCIILILRIIFVGVVTDMENKNTQIIMTDKISVRSGEDVAFVGFQILPKEDKQGFYIRSSENVSVNMKETDSEENLRVLAVRGKNHREEADCGFIMITLDDGQFAECEIEILPELSKPPRFLDTPEIIFNDGKAILKYRFEDIGENIDESDITWYRVGAVEKSILKSINHAKQSNEKNSRKIAVSKNNVPCGDIRLTMADIGKQIKVNIRPKHSNSFKGQGLNIISPIVCEENVCGGTVILNVANVVEDNTYDFEKGCFTIKGDMVYHSLKPRGKEGLVTESMGCGIYYDCEEKVKNMSLVITLEPERTDGNGFEALHQYDEIFIKYDPETGNGYGLHIEGTASDNGKVKFGIYKYKNGNGTLISEEVESECFRKGCEIHLDAKEGRLNAFVSYDDGENFSDTDVRADIKINDFGGFGFKHMAETGNGCRVSINYMEARYF